MKTLSIADLLVGPKPVDLQFKGEVLRVWVRNLSQTEKDLCQAQARATSRAFQKELEDPKSESHKLLVKQEVDAYTLDNLKDLWVSAHLLDKAVSINQKSLEDRDQTYIPEPEGEQVTVSELNTYENQVEETEDQRETNVLSAVKAAQVALREEVNGVSEADLKAAAFPSVIDQIINQYWQREYAANMLARATFTDEKCTKPAFKTVSEVKRLRDDVLQSLTEAHYGLLVEPEALKASGDESPS